MDIETNWSAEFFEPLVADVETKKSGRIVRRTSSLINAIVNEQTASAILVLGDPGSGKSVALRKLAGELVSEVKKTGRLPLYINLRDWQPSRNWSRDHPPSSHEFEEFLLSQVAGRDVFADHYLRELVEGRSRFAHLIENGRTFLILDSFDEIPQLLDQSEAGWLIDVLSDVIYRYVAGGYNSRGILASRYFRRPSLKYHADAILEIRPFSDEQLANALTRRSSYTGSQIRALFAERPHLIPALRNPFIAGLVPGFSNSHPDHLPESELELFETYIRERFEQCLEVLGESQQLPQMDSNELFQATTDIATTLVSNFGLEASLPELARVIGKQTDTSAKSVPAVANALKYGRLVRIGFGAQASFSFVHRRFAEFFLARRLMDERAELPLGDITADGRWREALVLFAGVAPTHTAKEIASYCVNHARLLPENSRAPTASEFLAGVHALQFLVASFKARRQVLEPFDSTIEDIVSKLLRPGAHTLAAKFGAEAIGLLPIATLQSLVPKALDLGSDWVGQTAIRSCRHLASLGTAIVTSVRHFVSSMPQSDFNRRHRDLMFSMSLASGLASIAHTIRFRRIDSLAASVAIVPLAAVDFIAAVITVPLLIIILYVLKYLLLVAESSPGLTFTRARSINSAQCAESNHRQRNRRHKAFAIFSPRVVDQQNFVKLRQKMRQIRKNKNSVVQTRRNLQFGSTGVFLLWRMVLILVSTVIAVNGDSLFWQYIEVSIHSSIVLACALTTIVLAFPWFHGWLGIQFLRVNPQLIVKGVLMLVAYLGLIFIFWIIDSMEFNIASNAITYAGWTFSIILILSSSYSVLVTGVRALLKRRRDIDRLRDLSNDRSWTRVQIAEQLLTLEGNDARFDFLTSLDRNRISPEGDWQGSGIPQLNSVKLDTKLAQLEEQWLGFNG